MLILFATLYILAFLFFIYKRAMVLIHFLQQEEYNNKRFLAYIIKHRNLLDQKLTIGLIILSLSTYFINDLIIHFGLLTTILTWFAWIQHNPLQNSKKPLVITARVKRLFAVIIIIAGCILVGIFFKAICTPLEVYGITILLVQAIPFLIIITNIILFPMEKIIQFKYLREAKIKLAKLNPIIIGITGSYGKTSTKHILAHILGTIAPTLATPNSVNTPMGITKIIREQLKPEHKFFIVEMGAYGKGSIAKLCKLTPPTYGIIISIGNAHFERFKSIENVAQAKFELATAIAQKDNGLIVVNAHAIEKKFIKQYCYANTVIVSSDANNPATYIINQLQQTITGLNFQINFANEQYTINTELYGLHQVDNISLCFALAHKIGIAPATIIAAMKLIPQIRHRLEITKEKSKPIIIDDAYNSNPVGFSSALKILHLFKQHGYRSILVTPGIVELGNLHDSKHFELGKKAASIVDYALIITPQRIQAFVDGFTKHASKEQTLLTFNTFGEVKNWLHMNTKDTDVILFENDLPDLYGSTVKF